jgi:hypothetical protein
MLNSNFFIVVLLSLVRASVYGAPYLLCVITGISGSAVHSELTSIPVCMGTVNSAPMSLFAPNPILSLGKSNGFFHFLLWMAWPLSHLVSQIIQLLTFVNTKEG